MTTENNLQIDIVIIPAPANTNKYGMLKVHSYNKVSNQPVNDAKVMAGSAVFTFSGEGIYSYTFVPPLSDEPLFVEINVSGIFEGLNFQRQYLEKVPVINGDIIFFDDFEWLIDRAAKTVALGFTVEVKKSALYGITAVITDFSQEKKGLEGTEFDLEPSIHKLFLDFNYSEILDLGTGPYKVTKLLAYLIDAEVDCDLVINLDLIPFLLLDRKNANW